MTDMYIHPTSDYLRTDDEEHYLHDTMLLSNKLIDAGMDIDTLISQQDERSITVVKDAKRPRKVNPLHAAFMKIKTSPELHQYYYLEEKYGFKEHDRFLKSYNVQKIPFFTHIAIISISTYYEKLIESKHVDIVHISRLIDVQMFAALFDGMEDDRATKLQMKNLLFPDFVYENLDPIEVDSYINSLKEQIYDSVDYGLNWLTPDKSWNVSLPVLESKIGSGVGRQAREAGHLVLKRLFGMNYDENIAAEMLSNSLDLKKQPPCNTNTSTPKKKAIAAMASPKPKEKLQQKALVFAVRSSTPTNEFPSNQGYLFAPFFVKDNVRIASQDYIEFKSDHALSDLSKSRRTLISIRSPVWNQNLRKRSKILGVSSHLQRAFIKVFSFHDNYRPAYFGTWRNFFSSINPRMPLRRNLELIPDYDINSDDEWAAGEAAALAEAEADDILSEGDDDEESETDMSESETNWIDDGGKEEKQQIKKAYVQLIPVIVGPIYPSNGVEIPYQLMQHSIRLFNGGNFHLSSIDPFDGAFEPPEAPKKRADVIEFPEENIPFLVQLIWLNKRAGVKRLYEEYCNQFSKVSKRAFESAVNRVAEKPKAKLKMPESCSLDHVEKKEDVGDQENISTETGSNLSDRIKSDWRIFDAYMHHVVTDHKEAINS